MQEAVEESVTNLMQANYCYLCDIKLSHPNDASSHYISKRHNKKVILFKQETLETLKLNESTEILTPVQNVTKEETFHCPICDVQFDRNAIAQHYQQDEHKKLEEAYCITCKILTMSKEQLWQHMHGAKHKNKLKESGFPAIDEQYGPFDPILPSNLRELMQLQKCQVCSANLPTIVQALNHYKTQKHKTLVQQLFKEREEKGRLCFPDKTEETVLPVRKNVEQKTGISSSQNMVDYDCFVCKMRVNAPSAQDTHRANFPHTELAKLKSALVSKGTTEEFWLHQNGSILCKLCNVQICTVLESNEHFESTSHHLSFYIWSQTLSTSKIPCKTDLMWFYCKICDKSLDCTSEADKHYLAPPHLKRSQLYCMICDLRHSTQEMLEIHYTTTLHKENLEKTKNFNWKNDVEENTRVLMPSWYDNTSETQNVQKPKVMETPKPKEDLPEILADTQSELSNSLKDIERNPSKNTTAVKEQVFEEIEKLVRTLYYSKTVPYDVALKFLKKVNIEVEELEARYKKKGHDVPKESSACSENDRNVKMQFDKDSIYGASYKNESPNAEDASNEDKYYSVPAKVQPELDIIDFPYLSTTTVKKNENIPNPAQHDVNAVDGFDNRSILDSNFTNNNVIVSTCKKRKKAKFRRFLHVDQTERLPQSGGTLESMIEEINSLKNQVEDKYPHEYSIEKEVLAEIERLITLINSDSIPPEETLRCLEKFNRELDLECFDAEEKENGWHEVGEDFKTEEGKFDTKYSYSKED